MARPRGHRPERQQGTRRYTDEQLLDYLRDLAARLGHTPSSLDLQRLHRPDTPSRTMYYTAFGSMWRALLAAGLAPYQRLPAALPRKYTDEDLLAHLRTLAQQLGRAPGIADLVAAQGPSPGSYKRLGGLVSALRQAGIEVPMKVAQRPKYGRRLDDTPPPRSMS